MPLLLLELDLIMHGPCIFFSEEAGLAVSLAELAAKEASLQATAQSQKKKELRSFIMRIVMIVIVMSATTFDRSTSETCLHVRLH